MAQDIVEVERVIERAVNGDVDKGGVEKEGVRS